MVLLAKDPHDVTPVVIHPDTVRGEQGVHVDHQSKFRWQQQEGKDAGLRVLDGVGHGVELEDLKDRYQRAQESRSDQALHTSEVQKQRFKETAPR